MSMANITNFKELVAKRQIPSKERMVALAGIPRNYRENDIRNIFHGNQSIQSYRNHIELDCWADSYNMPSFQVWQSIKYI